MDRSNETIADLTAEIRQNAKITGLNGHLYWNAMADRLDAAAKREELRWAKANGDLARMLDSEKAQGGNAAAMREALEKIAAWGPDPFIDPMNGDSSAIYENARYDENGKFLGREIPSWWGVAWRHDLKEFVALAKAALAATLRNCDVGTAKEQTKRFAAFCRANWTPNRTCSNNCPFKEVPDIGYCQSAWGQMPYEAAQEGGDHAETC